MLVVQYTGCIIYVGLTLRILCRTWHLEYLWSWTREQCTNPRMTTFCRQNQSPRFQLNLNVTTS